MLIGGVPMVERKNVVRIPLVFKLRTLRAFRWACIPCYFSFNSELDDLYLRLMTLTCARTQLHKIVRLLLLILILMNTTLDSTGNHCEDVAYRSKCA